MVLYNVTVNIDNEVKEEWLHWMQQEHIPQVMATGSFTGHQLYRLLHEEENGGSTYCIQYFTDTLQQLEDYQQRFAPALQKEHTERFRDRFVAFRTVLETV